MSKENNELTKRAKEATPNILNLLSNTAGPAVKELAGPLCDALTKYGCRNQIAVTNAVTVLNPLFREIAEQYFSLLNDTVIISLETDSRNYEIILNAIMADETASIDTKTQLAKEIIAANKSHNLEITDTVISKTGKIAIRGMSVIGLIIGAVSYIDFKKVQTITAGKTERTRIIIDGVVRTMDIPSRLARIILRR